MNFDSFFRGLCCSGLLLKLRVDRFAEKDVFRGRNLDIVVAHFKDLDLLIGEKLFYQRSVVSCIGLCFTSFSVGFNELF